MSTLLIERKRNTASQRKQQKSLEKLRPFIGNTPLFPLHQLLQNKKVELWAKLEWQQYGASVKARPAFAIFEDAVREGCLADGQSLLDASSGNTAIAYAYIGRAIGVPVTIVLPENASQERKNILTALGVHLIYSSPYGGTDEAQGVALALALKYPDKYYYADQYNNLANRRIHTATTAAEIWCQTKSQITHFVTGLGTTGTFVGTARGLNHYNTDIKKIALQPETALHGLEGWKHLETARVPGIYEDFLVDDHRSVTTESAYAMIKKVAVEVGLLLSPSAGAAVAGALDVASELESGVIVTVLADNADKYSETLKSLF